MDKTSRIILDYISSIAPYINRAHSNKSVRLWLAEVCEIEELRALAGFAEGARTKGDFVAILKRNKLAHEKIEYLIGRWEKIYKNPAPPNICLDKIKQRDGARCIYCFGQNYLEVHHVVPKAQGGADSEWNYVLACAKCNKRILQNIVLPRNWFSLHPDSHFSQVLKEG
jgi:hypothetical protein